MQMTRPWRTKKSVVRHGRAICIRKQHRNWRFGAPKLLPRASLGAVLGPSWGRLGAILGPRGRLLAVSCFRARFPWPIRPQKPILTDFGRQPENGKKRQKLKENGKI